MGESVSAVEIGKAYLNSFKLKKKFEKNQCLQRQLCKSFRDEMACVNYHCLQKRYHGEGGLGLFGEAYHLRDGRCLVVMAGLRR